MQKHLKEFFAHPSIWLIGLFALASLVSIRSSWTHLSIWLCLLIGALAFFVNEYTTHRFLFHSEPSQNAFIQELKNRLHYAHHEDPQDLNLLFLPIWYSIPNFALVYLFTLWITHCTALAGAVTAGALLALLYYEWVHFRAHRPIVPLSSFGKKMKKYHLRHHFLNENYWFGVTNPSLDYVGRTCPHEKAVELSPTARQLHQNKQASL